MEKFIYFLSHFATFNSKSTKDKKVADRQKSHWKKKTELNCNLFLSTKLNYQDKDKPTMELAKEICSSSCKRDLLCTYRVSCFFVVKKQKGSSQKLSSWVFCFPQLAGITAKARKISAVFLVFQNGVFFLGFLSVYCSLLHFEENLSRKMKPLGENCELSCIAQGNC